MSTITKIILVTGSSGHLGEALIRVMRKRNINAVGIDVLTSSVSASQNDDDNLTTSTTSHIGSIADKTFVRSILEKYETETSTISGIINTAVLHKPHIVSHTMQDFVDVNITGTLTLLDAFSDICCNSNNTSKLPFHNRFFIQTSTTSTYGDSLVSKDKSKITWIDESVVATPKNIYGVTKKSAEDVCQLFAKQSKIANVFVLQASRFFPEEDDDAERANMFGNTFHQQFIELLHRRVEIEDLVDVHLLAAEKALKRSDQNHSGIFKRYICSTPSPLSLKKDPLILQKLASQPGSKIIGEELFPELWSQLRGAFPDSFGKDIPVGIVDRIYCSEAAQEELGWQPKYSFEKVMKFLIDEKKKADARNEIFDGNWKSELAGLIGVKGYHRK